MIFLKRRNISDCNFTLKGEFLQKSLTNFFNNRYFVDETNCRSEIGPSVLKIIFVKNKARRKFDSKEMPSKNIPNCNIIQFSIFFVLLITIVWQTENLKPSSGKEIYKIYSIGKIVFQKPCRKCLESFSHKQINKNVHFSFLSIE